MTTLTPPAVKRELACNGCGYGVVVAGPPPVCPMCRGTVWHERRAHRA